ncbi:hypothetical protein V6N13_023103 [Hibiscus sabdariffa]
MVSCENFDVKVKELEQKLHEPKESGNDGVLDEDKIAKIKKCRLELWDNLRLQEELWKQKSTLNWFALGNANTKCFYRTVKYALRKE